MNENGLFRNNILKAKDITTPTLMIGMYYVSTFFLLFVTVSLLLYALLSVTVQSQNGLMRKRLIRFVLCP